MVDETKCGQGRRILGVEVGWRCEADGWLSTSQAMRSPVFVPNKQAAGFGGAGSNVARGPQAGGRKVRYPGVRDGGGGEDGGRQQQTREGPDGVWWAAAVDQHQRALEESFEASQAQTASDTRRKADWAALSILVASSSSVNGRGGAMETCNRLTISATVLPPRQRSTFSECCPWSSQLAPPVARGVNKPRD